jgi:hypothetical protein
MSRSHIRQPAADEAWLPQVTAALNAVRSLYQRVSRENGNTDRLIRQMHCLKQARAAWLSGARDRARRLLAAAMNPDDDGRLPAEIAASAPPSMNGQASEHSAAGPTAERPATDRPQADGSQSALG